MTLDPPSASTKTYDDHKLSVSFLKVVSRFALVLASSIGLRFRSGVTGNSLTLRLVYDDWYLDRLKLSPSPVLTVQLPPQKMIVGARIG